MEAVNLKPCSCELCQPHPYMGREDEFFAPKPVVTLEAHMRKLAQARKVDDDQRLTGGLQNPNACGNTTDGVTAKSFAKFTPIFSRSAASA